MASDLCLFDTTVATSLVVRITTVVCPHKERHGNHTSDPAGSCELVACAHWDKSPTKSYLMSIEEPSHLSSGSGSGSDHARHICAHCRWKRDEVWLRFLEAGRQRRGRPAVCCHGEKAPGVPRGPPRALVLEFWGTETREAPLAPQSTAQHGTYMGPWSSPSSLDGGHGRGTPALRLAWPSQRIPSSCCTVQHSILPLNSPS